MDVNNGGHDMRVELERTRVNLFHIGAIVVSLIVNTFAVAGVYFTLTNNDAQSGAQISELRTYVTNLDQRMTSRIEKVEQKIPQFEVIALQIQRLTEIAAQNTQAIQATNERMTRMVESQAGKLDNIITTISELSADVKVIQSQLNENARTERTRSRINNPVYKP